MDINLEYYKIFYYVGKLGGITLAAEALSISQPAVSQAVKHLEEALGSILFVRTSKGVRLTREGEVLYSYVKTGYEYMMAGEMQIKELLNLETGEVRIGASDMTLRFYLLPFLEEFHRKYPKIKVRVTNAPTPETIQYLKEGKIDFGVVSTPIVTDREWKIKPVKKIEDVFIAGPKFFYLKNQLLYYKMLEELPIICLEKNTSTRRYVDEFLMKNQVVLNPEFELATSDMLVQFARRNLGIAEVMRDFAGEYIRAGEVFELYFDKKIPQRDFCIISDKNLPISTAAAKLLQYLH